jgi:transcriptional regulator with XRE-family HTH domain
MDPTLAAIPAGTLGARLRQARRARGLTQAAVARPEFTKSYVSAVERGHARPSLKALELMARRVGVSMADLLAPLAPPPAFDMPALTATVREVLVAATWALATAAPQTALARLAEAEAQAGPAWDALPVALRFRLVYLRTTAYLAMGAPVDARAPLAEAADLARQLDAEAVVRVQHLTGRALLQQDLPQLALEQHRQCRAALERGAVQDPQLELAIYGDLVADYGALGEAAAGGAIAQEAQALLAGMATVAGQARRYWQRSEAARTAGQPEQAQRWLRHALDLWEAVDNRRAAAQLEILGARSQIQQADYAAAVASLARAAMALTGLGMEPAAASAVAQGQAELALHRGQLAAAADYAGEALEWGAAAYQAGASDRGVDGAALPVYLQALSLAGRVAAAQGDWVTAGQHFTQALALAETGGRGTMGAEIAYRYAEILLAQGRPAEANVYYRQAARRPPPLVR